MKKSLATLRDRKTGTAAFRRAATALCTALVRKTQALLKERGVSPQNIVVMPVLRAGLAFLEPALRAFPGAKAGVLGMKRDEHTFAPHWYSESLPPLGKRSVVILFDPMLATGGTAEAAVARLTERGAAAKNIYFVGVVAAPEGLARLAEHIPEENITLAALDKKLNKHNYIVPGIGDFGDRYFGYKR